MYTVHNTVLIVKMRTKTTYPSLLCAALCLSMNKSIRFRRLAGGHGGLLPLQRLGHPVQVRVESIKGIVLMR